MMRRPPRLTISGFGLLAPATQTLWIARNSTGRKVSLYRDKPTRRGDRWVGPRLSFASIAGTAFAEALRDFVANVQPQCGAEPIPVETRVLCTIPEKKEKDKTPQRTSAEAPCQPSTRRNKLSDLNRAEDAHGLTWDQLLDIGLSLEPDGGTAANQRKWGSRIAAMRAVPGGYQFMGRLYERLWKEMQPTASSKGLAEQPNPVAFIMGETRDYLKAYGAAA